MLDKMEEVLQKRALYDCYEEALKEVVIFPKWVLRGF